MSSCLFLFRFMHQAIKTLIKLSEKLMKIFLFKLYGQVKKTLKQNVKKI